MIVGAAVLAAVVVVVVVLALVVAPVRQRLTGSGAAASTTAPTPAATSTPATAKRGIGPDPRLADPCSLVDTSALARFGSTTINTDFDSFESCNVNVSPTDGGYFSVVLTFLTAASVTTPANGTLTTEGELQIVRTPRTGSSCDRTIVLPDQYQVDVAVGGQNGPKGDPCALDDAATNAAVARFNGPGIKQRPLPTATNSLSGVDFCALLDDVTLAAATGTAMGSATPGFVNWSCSWSNGPIVNILIKRYPPLASPVDGNPKPVGSRTGWVLPGGYSQDPNSCLVGVPQRTYTSPDGASHSEILELVYTSTGSNPTALCQVATRLSAATIPKLPPAS